MSQTIQDAPGLIASNPLWYHTLDVGEGRLTPGWFDVRTIMDRIPFPDVRGKRCLDIGTYDGFFAFEMERRGAAEVIATDISDERMVFAAGFEIIERSKPYCIGYGSAHPPRERNARELAKRVTRKVVCGIDGVPQSAVLARPRV